MRLAKRAREAPVRRKSRPRLRLAADQSGEAHAKGRVISRREHQQETQEQQADGPSCPALKKVVLKAEHSDGQKDQARSKKVLHLFGNASVNKDAGDQG